MADIFDFLAHVPIFSELIKTDLQLLAEQVEHSSFQAGEDIIKEGDRDSQMFIIVTGRVEVIKGRGQRHERLLAAFGPYDYFGEMALIDDLVRSATVRASEDTEVLSIGKLAFQKAIERNPTIALELLRVLSQRVRVLEKSLGCTLGGLLPICMNCKNIRDDSGAWVKMEEYIADRSDADFTHGICPECMKKLYPKHFQQELQSRQLS